MNNLTLIIELAREKKWNELEKVFSTTDCLEKDRGGNPGCITFFTENIVEAIVLGEKYHLISQVDIAFLIRFSSSSFRKKLVNDLLGCDTIKPVELFTHKKNYELLSLINNDYFQVINDYQNNNNKNKLFDLQFVKTIFSNKEFCEVVRSYHLVNSFVINNSEPESIYFLFNEYCTNHYFVNNKIPYVLEIIDYWKNNIDIALSFDFSQKIMTGVNDLEKKYKSPFTSKDNKQQLEKIIESIHNIELFSQLNNKNFEPNKKSKHKI